MEIETREFLYLKVKYFRYILYWPGSSDMVNQNPFHNLCYFKYWKRFFFSDRRSGHKFGMYRLYCVLVLDSLMLLKK